MKHRLTKLIASLMFFAFSGKVEADLLTYSFSGRVTEITTNSNGVIPNLAIGDAFEGYTTFESEGWQQTEGVVFVSLNGVDLLFDGPFIYGAVDVTPPSHYSIRIAGDTFGNIGDSTFSAGNFGPDLEDSDGSAGHTSPFPKSLNLAEFEKNDFRIWGTYVSTGDAIFVTGQLSTFTAVPEPTSGTMFLFLFGARILFSRDRN